MKLSMLKGLKEAFSKSELKAAAGAAAGGAAASVAHLLISTKVAWVDSSWKRIGVAAGLGIIGGHYVGAKHKMAGAGVMGAMGGVIGVELWNMFGATTVVAATVPATTTVKGLRGLPDAFPPPFSPLMSNFKGVTLMPGGAGVGFKGTTTLPGRLGGTQVMATRSGFGGFRGTAVTPIRRLG